MAAGNSTDVTLVGDYRNGKHRDCFIFKKLFQVVDMEPILEDRMPVFVLYPIFPPFFIYMIEIF